MPTLLELAAAPPAYPREALGRHCALMGEPEAIPLSEEEDLRRPRFRREVFLRFYGAHLKYRAHPGAVYAVLPALAELLGLDRDGYLWLCYVNGNTQNPVTSWIILNRYRTPAAFVKKGEAWFNAEWSRLQFDMDRRYQKRDFCGNVRWYVDAVGTDAATYFGQLAAQGFSAAWPLVRKRFPSFGRLSAFSYMEYLRIAGLPLECDDLFLEDMHGSMSHRNGLARVVGRDDLDFVSRDPHYGAGQLEWLQAEAARLLADARRRFGGEAFANDVGYFTLESALCTFKSWHRENRRYPFVYLDMFRDRIVWAAARWPELDFSPFWQMRRRLWPRPLRVEDNPKDVGVAPPKQNHYRLTGRTPMLGYLYPELWSPYDTGVQGVGSGEWHARNPRL